MIKGRDVWWEDEMEHAEHQIEKDGKFHYPPQKWMQKIRYSFYILPAVLANQKA